VRAQVLHGGSQRAGERPSLPQPLLNDRHLGIQVRAPQRVHVGPEVPLPHRVQVHAVHPQAAVLRLLCALRGPAADAVVTRRGSAAAGSFLCTVAAASVWVRLCQSALCTRCGICSRRGRCGVKRGRPETAAAASAAPARRYVPRSAGADQRREGASAARHAAAGAHKGGLTDDLREKRFVGRRLRLQPRPLRLLRGGARGGPQLIGRSVFFLGSGRLLCREGNDSRPAARLWRAPSLA
jgi:hypothetical protein